MTAAESAKHTGDAWAAALENVVDGYSASSRPAAIASAIVSWGVVFTSSAWLSS